VGNRPLCQRFCLRSARRDRSSFAPALDEEGLVKAICDAEKSAAEDRADEDHTVFWLVLADQSEKRGIFSTRVRDMALAIIDDGKDAAMMHRLGMKPADLHKRAANLGAVRAPIVAQPMVSKPRKTMKRPEPYVFDAGGVYIYPTRDGDTINPYMSPKYFNRTKWCPNGFGLMLVIGRGRAFDYLAWYQAVTSVEIVSSIPGHGPHRRDTLAPAHLWNMQPSAFSEN